MKLRALSILQAMVLQNSIADADEGADYGEIVREGVACMFGHDRISVRTLDELIFHGAVSRSSDSTERFERWTINETGEAIAKHPEIAPDIKAAYFLQKRFRIDGDRVIFE